MYFHRYIKKCKYTVDIVFKNYFHPFNKIIEERDRYSLSTIITHGPCYVSNPDINDYKYFRLCNTTVTLKKNDSHC